MSILFSRRRVLAGTASAIAFPFVMANASFAESEDAPIRIGVIVGDTGAYAFAGVVSHAAISIAVDHLNAAGGINGRAVIFDFQDDGGQTPQALTLLGRYAADSRYVAVIGPTSSPESLALSPVANNLKIPLLGATVVSSKPLEAGEWSFKTAADPASVLKELATVVSGRLPIRRVAVVFGRENDAQVAQKAALAEGMIANGAQIVADIGVLNADTNFSGTAQKIVASKPDALFVALTADASANVIVQARSAGLPKDIVILGTSQSVSDRYLSIGGGAIDGTIAGTDYNPLLPSDLNARFVRDYKAKVGQSPDAYAALGYQSVLILTRALHAIGRASLSRESLKESMLNLKSLDGILGSGHCVFENRVPRYGAAILRIEKGKFVSWP